MLVGARYHNCTDAKMLKMAAPVSDIIWLHFCTMGGRGDSLSIIYLQSIVMSGTKAPVAQFGWGGQLREESWWSEDPSILRIIVAKLGIFNAADFCSCVPQVCVVTQSSLRALQSVPSTSWLGLHSYMHRRP